MVVRKHLPSSPSLRTRLSYCEHPFPRNDLGFSRSIRAYISVDFVKEKKKKKDNAKKNWQKKLLRGGHTGDTLLLAELPS